ncbi:tetratricopeptide repeat protein, partial [Acidobacteriota bacterium]
ENPENTSVSHYLAWNYIDQGKYDLAHIELNRLFEKTPTDFFIPLLTGDIQLLNGELIQAEKSYLSILEKIDPSGIDMAMVRLFYLYNMQGRYQKSLELFKEIESIVEANGRESFWMYKLGEAAVYMNLRTNNPEKALEEAETLRKMSLEKEYLGTKRIALQSLIIALLNNKNIEKADQTAEELKGIVEAHPNKKLIWEYYLVKGLVENERRNYAQAIQLLNNALDFFPKGSTSSYIGFPIDKILLLDSLGSAYYNSGNMDQAIDVYKKIKAMTTQRIVLSDLYVKAFFNLGKIHEQQGNKTKAIENYEEFLELWKNADPGISEVEEARQSLSVLRE